jgi:NAD(P)-dependent dehydrogenase (short-subunit alcohol dehydrogenase family)
MKGKTVLFTGASPGMGRFAAINLARRGAEILVVGHNDARGAAALDAMRGTGGSAAFLRADMGDAEDVCALAEAVLARGGSLDVLFHSAGARRPIPLWGWGGSQHNEQRWKHHPFLFVKSSI